jgi:phage terminase large subunit-like protein
MMRVLATCAPAVRAAVWDQLCASDLRSLEEEWSWKALPGQREPPASAGAGSGGWRNWLIVAGRGFGQTRAGAEWVLARARETPDARIALVGGSLDEVAAVMVEGESGILACARTGEKLSWRSTTGRLKFPSGAVAMAYSGASPDRLRGPQHHFAWADEIAKWQYPDATWDNLQMGLRLGDPSTGSGLRAIVTTTPKPIALLGRLIADAETKMSGGRTFDNPHLPESFVAAMRGAYAGSRLGRQELDGALLTEAEGALWTRDVIEARRCAMPRREELRRVVIGVDPPASEEGACGIVVCGLLGDGRGAVLADCSLAGVRPEGWAARVADAFRNWAADRVVAEANNGGRMVETVLRTVAPGLPIKLVHASQGKAARAEPVAAAFETGRCLFAAGFPELEDELTALTPGGYLPGRSPDRADAMVWALTELVVNRLPEPRVRGL